MTRVNIPTEDGLCWFDLDRATEYQEAVRWDGHNNVSVNDAGPYGHQILYLTAGGRWILHTWSQRQSVQPRYEFVEDQVREWLILNEHDGAAEKHFGEIEEERTPGRPEVGERVCVRLGQLLAPVDAYAGEHQWSRAEAIRRLVGQALAARGHDLLGS